MDGHGWVGVFVALPVSVSVCALAPQLEIRPRSSVPTANAVRLECGPSRRPDPGPGPARPSCTLRIQASRRPRGSDAFMAHGNGGGALGRGGHARTHARTDARTHMHTHTHTCARVHTHMQTRTHARAHPRAHTTPARTVRARARASAHPQNPPTHSLTHTHTARWRSRGRGGAGQGGWGGEKAFSAPLPPSRYHCVRAAGAEVRPG